MPVSEWRGERCAFFNIPVQPESFRYFTCNLASLGIWLTNPRGPFIPWSFFLFRPPAAIIVTHFWAGAALRVFRSHFSRVRPRCRDAGLRAGPCASGLPPGVLARPWGPRAQ